MCLNYSSLCLSAVYACPVDVSLKKIGLEVALKLKLEFLDAFFSCAIYLCVWATFSILTAPAP